MEHAIGTRITLEVVENKEGICKGCFFKERGISCGSVQCDLHERTDRKNIIYKEVKR